MLTIYIDFKSAASYLALEPTLKLIDETGVEVRWLPFSSRPFKIPAEHKNETTGDTHRRVRATTQRDVHLYYAEAQGLDMQYPSEPGRSNAALATLANLKGDPVPFIRAAFKAYWTKQANLNDRKTVTQTLQTVGHEEPDWTAADSLWEMAYTRAEELKVFDTPTYIIDDQIFLGREHLPWIKTIING